MNDVTVSVHNLSKCFKVYSSPWNRAIEWLRLGKTKKHEDYWALRDISFQVNRGECIGIIGPNGAGKSTLLKILTRSLHSSSGTFNIKGRVLSLLELGTGFNAELTGRQNVINSARILGFPEGHINNRMESIEKFAELGEFFDRSLKTYSTGMYLRLAFSLFTCLNPDVFIIDEALAVGDAGFMRKCYRRMEDLRSNSLTTILLVTHDTGAIVNFCTRAILLDEGKIVFEGAPQETVELYQKRLFGEDISNTSFEEYGDGGAIITDIWFEDPEGNNVHTIDSGDEVFFCYRVKFHIDIKEPIFGMRIKTMQGIIISATNTFFLGKPTGKYKIGETVEVKWKIRLPLVMGDYFFSCGCSNLEYDNFLTRRVDVVKLSVIGNPRIAGLLDTIINVNVNI